MNKHELGAHWDNFKISKFKFQTSDLRGAQELGQPVGVRQGVEQQENCRHSTNLLDTAVLVLEPGKKDSMGGAKPQWHEVQEATSRVRIATSGPVTRGWMPEAASPTLVESPQL